MLFLTRWFGVTGSDAERNLDKEKSEIEEITARSEEHTSELQSRSDLVCRLLLEKKKKNCDRKSTTVNSSDDRIPKDVFCLKIKRLHSPQHRPGATAQTKQSPACRSLCLASQPAESAAC